MSPLLSRRYSCLAVMLITIENSTLLVIFSTTESQNDLNMLIWVKTMVVKFRSG